MVYGTSEHIQIDQERNEKTSERLNYFVARLDGSGSSTSCPPGKAPYLFSLFSCSPLQGPDKRVASTDLLLDANAPLLLCIVKCLQR